VQFAYEFSDKDQWLKEGTAVWIEDEIFDSVNASRSYLEDTVLLSPEIPLDYASAANDAQDFEYGAWIFWRFLSETTGAETLRQVWEETAPTQGSDPSALSALKAVIPDFRAVFNDFAVRNLFYFDPSSYEEGPAWFEHLRERLRPYDALYLMDAEYSFTAQRQVELAGLAQGHVTFRVHPAYVANTTLWIYMSNFSFDGELEVTALVEFPGETSLISYPLGANDAVGFDQAEAVTLVYSNAASSPDNQVVRYEAELVPFP
jgi:hypothetical protein